MKYEEVTYNQTLKTVLDEQPYPMLFVTISGAHLFGFPSHDSDYDLRGVHILPVDDMLGLHGRKETIDRIWMKDNLEIDLVTHDVLPFFLLLLKKSGNIIERILSPLVMHTTPEHEELKAIVPKTLTVHHAHHYFGFSRKKWGEFSETKHTAKALLYTYRTLLTGIHLMKTGEIESNLLNLNAVYQLPYIPDLIEAKLSGDEKGVLQEADIAFHTREYERITEMLRQAQAESHLPEHPQGKEELNDLLIRIRRKYGENRT